MKIKQGVLISILSLVVVALGVIIFLQSDYSAKKDPAVNKGKPEKVPNQIVVAYRENITKAKKKSLESKYKLALKNEIPQINTRVYRTPNQSSTDALISILSKEPAVEYVSQDKKVSLDLIPNDPWYGYWQYPYKQMRVQDAWDISTGSPSVTVAVFDTGLEINHEDLKNKVDLKWNIVRRNTDVTDNYGHGTAVSGVAVAEGNNGLGIASSCWGCRLMVMKVGDGPGDIYYSDIADALVWAADHGAKVASLSMSPLDDGGVENSMRYFISKGGVVFGSAGNTSSDTGLNDSPYYMVVSGLTELDMPSSVSSFGNNVDISAPSIGYTTLLGNKYGNVGGASIATPYVAGIAGLILSVNPLLTSYQVEDILEKSADDYGTAGWDKYYGWGRVNAHNALVMAENYSSNTDKVKPTVSITYPTQGSTVPLSSDGTVTIKANATDNIGIQRVDFASSYRIKFTDVEAPFEFTHKPFIEYGLTSGEDSIQAIAYDSANNSYTTRVDFKFTTSGTSDTTKPTVSITSPTTSSTVTGTTTISATATDNVGVKEVIFYATDPKDGTNYPVGKDTTSPYSVSWNTTSFANGTSSITAVAYDTSNNQTTSSPISVTISNQAAADTTPPTVSISSPTNGATVSGNINISVTASDNVAVQEVFATLTNDTTGIATSLGTDTTSPYAFTIDTKLLTNGTYTLQVTAVDTSGNLTTKTISINILNATDTQAPTITITSPANNSTLPKKPNVTITNTHSDNTGVVKVELYIDNTKYSESYSYPFTFNWNTKKTASGTHTIQLKAYDAAGNVGVSNIVTVIK